MPQEEFQTQVLACFEQIDSRFDALDKKIDCLRDEMNGKFASPTLNDHRLQAGGFVVRLKSPKGMRNQVIHRAHGLRPFRRE